MRNLLVSRSVPVKMVFQVVYPVELFRLRLEYAVDMIPKQWSHNTQSDRLHDLILITMK
jgi:hypothetical protein